MTDLLMAMLIFAMGTVSVPILDNDATVCLLMWAISAMIIKETVKRMWKERHDKSRENYGYVRR